MKKILLALLVLCACYGQEFPDWESTSTARPPTEEEANALAELYAGDYDPATENPVEADEKLAYDASQPIEKIYVEGDYGWEPNQLKCSPPWASGLCAAPDLRTFTIGVHSYTCGTQIFKDQLLDSANYIRDVANANGWNVYQVNNYTTTPANPEGAFLVNSFNFRCTSNSAVVPVGVMGRTDCSESIDNIWDCHDTSNGRFCQYKRCVMSISVANITAQPMWQASSTTNTQRGRFIENVGRHEGGHGPLGFGHGADWCVTMQASVDGSALTCDWAQLLTFTNAEKHQLDCYKETSGTTSNCQ